MIMAKIWQFVSLVGNSTKLTAAFLSIAWPWQIPVVWQWRGSAAAAAAFSSWSATSIIFVRRYFQKQQKTTIVSALSRVLHGALRRIRFRKLWDDLDRKMIEGIDRKFPSWGCVVWILYQVNRDSTRGVSLVSTCFGDVFSNCFSRMGLGHSQRIKIDRWTARVVVVRINLLEYLLKQKIGVLVFWVLRIFRLLCLGFLQHDVILQLFFCWRCG